ncbi:hypothetical protein A6U86_33520 [Rhizobium sp. AC27/96]|jgi:hypothetical protein|nr:hypothetical protein A6U86_33520 [Rhizobium sp. AC27/96]TIX93365.1 DUF3429 domain-containing protein [Rhizobium sp. P44RR-XXIV]
MGKRHRRLAIVLTYLGTMPFWLLILVSIFAPQFEAQSAFIAYGAIIASFMAGTLWRSALNVRGKIFISLSSNVLALVAFATLLTGSITLGLIAQMILFGVLLVVDAQTIAANSDLRWYLKVRERVTLAVVIAYCLMTLVSVL